MAEDLTPAEVQQAIDDFAAVIEACSSPVQYAMPVGEERFQRDKEEAVASLEEERRRALEASQPPAPRRKPQPRGDGGP